LVGPVTIVSTAAIDPGIGGSVIDVSCPANMQIIGGGYQGSSNVITTFSSRILTPGLGGTYRVAADDGGSTTATIIVSAYCI